MEGFVVVVEVVVVVVTEGKGLVCSTFSVGSRRTVARLKNGLLECKCAFETTDDVSEGFCE